jgi:hypothetical protein
MAWKICTALGGVQFEMDAYECPSGVMHMIYALGLAYNGE